MFRPVSSLLPLLLTGRFIPAPPVSAPVSGTQRIDFSSVLRDALGGKRAAAVNKAAGGLRGRQAAEDQRSLELEKKVQLHGRPRIRPTAGQGHVTRPSRELPLHLQALIVRDDLWTIWTI